jgi:hypothetical protein
MNNHNASSPRNRSHSHCPGAEVPARPPHLDHLRGRRQVGQLQVGFSLPRLAQALDLALVGVEQVAGGVRIRKLHPALSLGCWVAHLQHVRGGVVATQEMCRDGS